MSEYTDGFTRGFVEVKLAQAGTRRVIDHLLGSEGSSGLALDAVARQHAVDAENVRGFPDDGDYATGYADGRAAAERDQRA